MKTFKVQQIHFTEKKASVTVEAESGLDAIQKARSLQWEDFEEREIADQLQWKLISRSSMTFFERLLFLFTGDDN